MLNYYATRKRQTEIKRDLLIESLLAKINESTVELASDEITLPEFFRLVEDLKDIYTEACEDVKLATEGFNREAAKVGERK